MPLSIKKRGKIWYVRGTVKGQYVYESTGESERTLADAYRLDLENKLSSGKRGEKIFMEAIAAYLEAGGETRFLEPLKMELGHYPLSAITQDLLDTKAMEIYPNIKPVSRRRQFYDPAVAIMKAAAIRGWVEHRLYQKPKFKRPPAKYAEPDWFKEFWAECETQKEDELLAITTLLPYTGLRISEALRIRWQDIDIENQSVYIEKTKNSEARTAYLPDHVLNALINIKKGNGRVFSYFDRTAVNRAIKRILRPINARRKEKGLDPLPYLSTHKIGSHTYATWMRKYAGLDHTGLVATGRWKHQSSTFIYTHAKVSEEAKKSDLLPTISRAKAVQ